MRDDVLAKRLFYGGCLGLPWLWLVQVMYWYGKERQDSQEEQSNQEALLNNADTNDGENDAALSPKITLFGGLKHRTLTKSLTTCPSLS